MSEDALPCLDPKVFLLCSPAGGGGGRGGFVSGIVSRGRARMEAQRAAAAGRWIRARRLLNRVLGTNEVLSVSAHAVAPALCFRAGVFQIFTMSGTWQHPEAAATRHSISWAEC